MKKMKRLQQTVGRKKVLTYDLILMGYQQINTQPLSYPDDALHGHI